MRKPSRWPPSGEAFVQDYADQRYYKSNAGGFYTPDPAGMAAVDLKNPTSWNMYAYAGDDPVNFLDPTGLLISANDPELTGQAGWNWTWVYGMYWYSNPSPTLPNPGEPGKDALLDEWDNFSTNCQNALTTAMGGKGDNANVQRVLAANRAMQQESILAAAAAGTGIDWTLLAAIGVRESKFVSGNEADGKGIGVGVFQITVSPTSGVTAAQAGNLAWAANWAANDLVSNAAQISKAIPGLSPDLLVWMTAASFNTGAQGQINRYNNGQSPDYHTAPIGNTGQYRNDYGSNVLALQDCFK